MPRVVLCQPFWAFVAQSPRFFGLFANRTRHGPCSAPAMVLRSCLGLWPARAALPLALLLAGCGSTTANDRAGSAGGADSGGSANAHAGGAGTAASGNASGGSTSGGSSGTSDGAGGRESGGGAAGRDQGAGGGAGSLCPGAMLDPARAMTLRCSTVADCQDVLIPRCQTTPPTYECGGPVPIHECDTDPDCGTGRVCNPGGCGSTLCVDACPTRACASSEDCANGRCVTKACDAAGALPCGSGTECKSANGGAATCQAIACGAGFACPATWDCAPGPKADTHGCVHRACSNSAECACGFCVSGLCEPTPGYCFTYAPRT